MTRVFEVGFRSHAYARGFYESIASGRVPGILHVRISGKKVFVTAEDPPWTDRKMRQRVAEHGGVLVGWAENPLDGEDWLRIAVGVIAVGALGFSFWMKAQENADAAASAAKFGVTGSGT